MAKRALLVFLLCLTVFFSITELLDLKVHIWIFFSPLIVALLFLYYRRSIDRLFSPHLVCIFYFIFNFLVGMFVLKSELGLSYQQILEYQLWPNYNEVITYYLVCLSLWILYLEFVPDLKIKKFKQPNENSILVHPWYVELAFIIFSLFIFYFILNTKINLDFLGGKGSFHNIPTTFFMLSVAVVMRNSKLYFFIILAFIYIYSANTYQSKREIIFTIPFFLYLYFLSQNLKPSKFKIAGIITISAFLITTFVIAMSIMRGYGGGASSLGDAILKAPSYLTNSESIGYILRNFEISYFFFAAVNSVNAIIEGELELLYGASIMKSFLVAFPETVFNLEKPPSIIEYYTHFVNPEYRGRGGSLPTNLFAEFFINFHWFGILLLPFLFVFVSLVDITFRRALAENNIANCVFALYTMKLILILVRGSGMDQFVVYLIVGVFFWVALFFFELTLKKGANIAAKKKYGL